MSSNDGFFFKNGSKTVILLFHGLTGSPFEMFQYGKSLSNNGYDVYCPILPGHCKTVEDLKKLTWQDWNNFALEKFDELSQKYENVFVAGLCLGGVIALRIAQERKNIAGVIGLSTTLFLDGWDVPWYRFLTPLVLFTVYKFFYLSPETEYYGVKNETIRKKISQMQGENTGGALNYYPMLCLVESYRYVKLVKKEMNKIIAPALLVHSIEDNLTSLRSAEFVFNNVSSKEKKIVKLENSYHVITLDNDRKEVVNQTIDFIKKFEKKTESGEKQT